MSTLVLGIDEAGRGPALGPLVLAAVALDPSAARRLTRIGVKDSKRYGAGERAHATRLRLVERIMSIAAHVDFELCDVGEVDAAVAEGALNQLERERARRLILRAPEVCRIVADGERLFSALQGEFPALEARDGGEAVHVAVAAASIMAKTRRDDLFACISARYAPAFGALKGGGYVNTGTRSFTEAFRQRNGWLPPEARQSWPWPKRAKFLRVPDVLNDTHVRRAVHQPLDAPDTGSGQR